MGSGESTAMRKRAYRDFRRALVGDALEGEKEQLDPAERIANSPYLVRAFAQFFKYGPRYAHPADVAMREISRAVNKYLTRVERRRIQEARDCWEMGQSDQCWFQICGEIGRRLQLPVPDWNRGAG